VFYKEIISYFIKIILSLLTGRAVLGNLNQINLENKKNLYTLLNNLDSINNNINMNNKNKIVLLYKF